MPILASAKASKLVSLHNQFTSRSPKGSFHMLKPLLLCVSLSCVLGCSGANKDELFGDAWVSDADAGPKLQLVCADNFCGKIVDKGTGLTVNCGACTTNGVCGDNGIANVCGAQC